MTTDKPAAAGFTGYASTFWACDSYGTAFAPGCFAKSLAERGTDFPCLWQHNPDAPIGRHLAIREDATGLYVDIQLSEDGAEGSVAAARLRDEIPLGMSFGFRTRRSRPVDDDDPLDESTLAPLGIARKDVEVITAVDLFEDSVVTFPANRRAKILAVRRRKSDAQRQADAAFFRSELRDLRRDAERFFEAEGRNLKAEFAAMARQAGIDLPSPTPSRPPLRPLPPTSRKETIVPFPDSSTTPRRLAVRSAQIGPDRNQAPLYDHRALSVPNVVRKVVARSAPQVVPAGFCPWCGDRPLAREFDLVCDECNREMQRAAAAAEEQQG
ncbi:MAG: HK97 family phage prohead protease [Chloroflexota bacterium]|nr:HK97 family phage prohead protease [Chloroflexota bacterium]